MFAMRTLLCAALALEAAWSFRTRPKKAQAGLGSPPFRTEVKELFTFGSPGTGDYAAWNEARTGPGGSECFPGLRFYKEGWHSNIKYQDFAAALCCNQLHAKQNVVVLGPDGSPNTKYWGGYTGYSGGSMYAQCNDTDDGRVGWPNPWGGASATSFHNYYSNNIRDQTLDHWADNWYWENGPRDRDQFIRAYPGAEVSGSLMANLVPDNMSDNQVNIIRDWIERSVNGKDWQPVHSGRFNMKLVGALEVEDNILGFPDYDQIVLVQQQGDGAPAGVLDNDCILAFEGTDGANEALRNINQAGKQFCGHWRHAGYVNEVRAIVQNPRWKPQIQDKLSRCRSVTVAGMSLGGSIAEVFSFCAMRWQSSWDTEDWRNIAWDSGPSGWAGERLGEITRGDGDGQGVVR